MGFQESETVELKRTYVEDIRKEIIAMANGVGGVVYVGVNDDGSIEGVSDCDALIQRIANGVRDAIKPDLTMFLHYDAQELEGKTILAISVQSGTNKPYYLSAKGLRPEGVFVRQGTSSVPASDAAIRQMIKDTDGDSYESLRSLEQTLTFEEATNAFAAKGLPLGTAQMRTLGLVGADGLFTNLGLLLSDQCPPIIKAATFNGQDQQAFQDRREFGGSLLKQIHDAYGYLALRNQNHATYEGLYRLDQSDYPAAALREALLNAIVHRDYAFAAPTLLSVYSDRMEFTSVGGLVPGISLEAVLLGLSVCRNPKLANVFYRLNLIEAYGTGLGKIQSAYAGYPQKPTITATAGAFKVVLPKQTPKAEQPASPPVEDNLAAILQALQEQGSITRHEVEVLLGVTTSTAHRLLQQLLQEKRIRIAGKGKNTCYHLS